MAKVIFLLKDRKEQKPPKGKNTNDQLPRLVYLLFSFGYYRGDSKGIKRYKPIKISTAESILPKFWNGRPVYRAKEVRNFPEYPEFNARLDFLESSIKNVYRRLINNRILNPSPDLIRKEYDKEIGKTKSDENITLISFIDNFIKENKNLREENTIKKYQGTLNHLKNYSKSRNKTLEFGDIDLTFYADFHNYLVKELLLTDNTFGKYIATLKGFLTAAAQRGHEIPKEVKTKEFKVITKDIDKIYLSNNEIKNIYKLNLKKDKRLERVRDVFILDCYLGLRFSDISSLTSKNITEINGTQFIKMRTKKTDADVVFPIHPTVTKILEKYHNELPKSISNQKTNEFLKEIGELAGIEDDVVIYKTIGGVRKKLEYKKYELITTHTARRSFATNAFKMGMPTISIMKMTGHSTEGSFMRYIRISQEENALAMMDHPFFKPNSKVSIKAKSR